MMECGGLTTVERGIPGGTPRVGPEKVELCGEVVDWRVLRIEVGSDEGLVMEL